MPQEEHQAGIGVDLSFEQIVHEFLLVQISGRCGCSVLRRGPALSTGPQGRLRLRCGAAWPGRARVGNKSELLTPLMCSTSHAARSCKLEQPKPARNIQQDKAR